MMPEANSHEGEFTTDNMPDLTAETPIPLDPEKPAIASNYQDELAAVREARISEANERARRKAEELKGDQAA